MLGRRIRQHHRVVAVGVAEIVRDALLLHQAADEVEVGLPILDAVVPLPVSPRQLQLEVRRLVIGEHHLDDVGNLHVLEDPAVGRARQEPEPGTHRREVPVVAAIHAALRKARDVAVVVPRLILGQPQFDRDVLAENVVDRDVVLHAEEIELVLERPAHLLARAHAMEQQDVLAERRDDFHHSSHDIPRHRRRSRHDRGPDFTPGTTVPGARQFAPPGSEE